MLLNDIIYCVRPTN